MEWYKIFTTTVLFAWGTLALVSGVRNDGKSRFLIIGIDHLFDKSKHRTVFIRIKNIVFGALCVD